MGLFEKNELVALLEELAKRRESLRAGIAAGEIDDTLAAIDEARRMLAGSMLASLDRVDAATVVMLLGRERAQVYVELARLEAQAREAMPDADGARRAATRAEEIAQAM
jgi:hypothetical protein